MQQRERYRIGDLIVDVEAVSVLREDQPIALPRLSFDLLVALARRAPSVVGLDERSRPKVLSTAEGAVATRSPGVRELLARAGSYLSLHQERNNELAIELYRRALQLEPKNPQALAGLRVR